MINDSQIINSIMNGLSELTQINNNAFIINQQYFNLFDTIYNILELTSSSALKKKIFVSFSYNDEYTVNFLKVNGEQNKYYLIL